MSKIERVSIDAVDANPFRRLNDYPFVERKLEALQRSIKDVGLWEGIIARKVGNRNQIAFGHHRLEAAKRNGLGSVALIMRSLTDEQMLAFMGRENMEDYNSEFLCLLETWEAAHGFLFRKSKQEPEAIDIAKLLGWTRPLTQRDGMPVLTDAARACYSAYTLIDQGHMKRTDLKDLPVSSAGKLVEHVHATHNMLDKMAKTTKRDHKSLDEAKKRVAKAGQFVAGSVRDGQVLSRDIRGKVDVTAYRFAKESKATEPLFEVFGKMAIAGITRMLNGDATDEKLQEIKKILGDLEREEDKRIIALISFELEELAGRVETRKKWMIFPKAKLASISREVVKK